MSPYRTSTRAPKIKKMAIPERQAFPSDKHLGWFFTIALAAFFGGAAGALITYIDGALR